MHELSLTEDMLRLIEEQAAKDGFSRVRRVCLEIGDLSSVEPDAMAFCFEAVAKGNRLVEGASLDIRRIPGRAVCDACGRESHIASRVELCTHCGGARLSVTGGTEMRIRELEVDG